MTDLMVIGWGTDSGSYGGQESEEDIEKKEGYYRLRS